MNIEFNGRRQWRDADGRKTEVAKLDDKHLLNALRYTERLELVLKYRALSWEARRRGLIFEAKQL